ncbi:MAG TPA: alpha-L-fucosidase [Oscillospiraceae bacterium]|nr:alpha-L-fucosidase [Oscillospiraceae bacterium]HPR74781.1 alpha-L-fucosidase [Oscillospiraceae bacterium]
MTREAASMETVNIHRQNPPQWFKDADFGIFIHWGPSSVPAFAPVDVDDYAKLMREKPPEYMFQNNPYADWYQNSMRIKGSPAAAYHKEHFGDQPYTAFAEEFKKRAKTVDVEQWADLFQQAGAKYVVVVSKHHDGFVLFDTKVENPKIPGYHLDFDHVGNLAAACRKRGMRFGVYYSSLLDWTFTKKPITSAGGLFLSNDNSKTYCDYCFNQWKEIIDRYHPDVLWGDIGYPTDPRLEELFAYYYAQVPEGVVNDRWGQWPNSLRNPIGRALVTSGAKKMLKENPGKLLDTKYYDFRTLEYTADWQENELYFEVCRGMDKSFGYNRFSRPQDYITAKEVRDIIAEVVPKKGRLLLNAGPDSYGKIPDYQVKILKELGGQAQ